MSIFKKRDSTAQILKTTDLSSFKAYLQALGDSRFGALGFVSYKDLHWVRKNTDTESYPVIGFILMKGGVYQPFFNLLLTYVPDVSASIKKGKIATTKSPANTHAARTGTLYSTKNPADFKVPASPTLARYLGYKNQDEYEELFDEIAAYAETAFGSMRGLPDILKTFEIQENDKAEFEAEGLGTVLNAEWQYLAHALTLSKLHRQAEAQQVFLKFSEEATSRHGATQRDIENFHQFLAQA